MVLPQGSMKKQKDRSMVGNKYIVQNLGGLEEVKSEFGKDKVD